jgi:hypothetical protein
MKKHRTGPYKELIDAFFLYCKGFEQNENEKKEDLLKIMHSAIRNMGSIEMDERGYGDYLSFIYLICKLADVSTPESPLPLSPYALEMSFGGLMSDLQSDFVTMSIDVLHKGFDPHVVGVYSTGKDSLELYDNQMYMYEDKMTDVNLDMESSYIFLNTSEIETIFQRLEVVPEHMTLLLRRKHD